jgi:hypothetical protein
MGQRSGSIRCGGRSDDEGGLPTFPKEIREPHSKHRLITRNHAVFLTKAQAGVAKSPA